MNKIVRSAQAIEPTRSELQATSAPDKYQAPTALENDPELFFKACNPQQFALSHSVETPVNAAAVPFEENREI